MPAENGNPPSAASPDRPPRILLRRLDQLGLAVVALVAMVFIGGYWLDQAVIRHRVIDLDKAPSRGPGYKVDINTAEWPELAQMPGIGESLGRKIVAWRGTHGPFKSLAELRRVKGIGPKKFEAMQPFLRPIPPAAGATGLAIAQARHSGLAPPP